MINPNSLQQLWNRKINDTQTWGDYFIDTVYPWSECRSFMCPIPALLSQPWAHSVCSDLVEVNEKIFRDRPDPKADGVMGGDMDWARAMLTIADITKFVKKGWLRRSSKMKLAEHPMDKRLMEIIVKQIRNSGHLRGEYDATQLKTSFGYETRPLEYWIIDKAEKFSINLDNLEHWWRYMHWGKKTCGEFYMESVFPWTDGLSFLMGWRALKTPQWRWGSGYKFSAEQMYSLALSLNECTCSVNPRIIIGSPNDPEKMYFTQDELDNYIDWEELFLTIYCINQGVLEGVFGTEIDTEISRREYEKYKPLYKEKHNDVPLVKSEPLPEPTPEERPWMPLEVLKSTNAKPIKIQPPTLDTEIGWLSPEGKLYPCGKEKHNDLQYALEKELNIPDIEEAGWIKLGWSAPPNSHREWHLGEKPATKEQIDTIMDWSNKHEVRYPDWIGTDE